MKKGTKKIIIRTLQDRIENYERSISSCRKSTNFDMSYLIEKLTKKVEDLKAAIEEIEAI